MRRVVCSVARTRRVVLAASRAASFTASTFGGDLQTDEVFPFPTATRSEDDVDNFTTALGVVADAAAGPGGRLKNADLQENGFYGMCIPEELGGLGLSFPSAAALTVATANADAATASKLFGHQHLCTALVSQVGSAELRGKYLPKMSDGSATAAWAVSEAHTRDDYSQMRAAAKYTTASVTGDETSSGAYILSGEKAFVINAENSTLFFVAAKTPTQKDGPEGQPTMVDRLTVFIVDASATGGGKVDIVDTVELVNGVSMSTVRFTDVMVPVDNVIGVAGEGQKTLLMAYHCSHYAEASIVVGAAQRVVTLCTDAISKNSQITSLSASTAVHAVADLAAQVYTLEAAAATLANNMELKVPDHLIEDASVQILASQLAVSLTAFSLKTACLGPDVATKVDAICRSVLHIPIANQSVDLMKFTVACCGAEERGVVLGSSSTLTVMQNRTMRSLGIRGRFPSSVPANIKAQADAIEKAILTFQAAVEKVVFRSGPRMKNEYVVLERLGTCAAHLFGAAAALSRCSRSMTEKGVTTGGYEACLLAHGVAASLSALEALSDELVNLALTSDENFARITMDLCDRVADDQ